MLQLNAGFSRKVGEPNYGSRGASVNVELEIESSLINDPQALTGRIRNLFAIAKQAVDEELGNGQAKPGQPTQPANGGNRPQPGGNRGVRYATASQVRAIRAIADQRQIDPDQLANERFRVNGIDELTIREASTLIDELKAIPANGRTGGRR